MQPIQRGSLLSLLSKIVISRDFTNFNTLYDVFDVSISVGKDFQGGSQAPSYLDLRTLSIRSLCSHSSNRLEDKCQAVVYHALQLLFLMVSGRNQCRSSFSSLDLQLHKMSPQAQEPAALPWQGARRRCLLCLLPASTLVRHLLTTCSHKFSSLTMWWDGSPVARVGPQIKKHQQ